MEDIKARVKEVVITRSRKVWDDRLGSIEYGLGVTLDIKPGDDPDNVIDGGYIYVNEALKRNASPMKKWLEPQAEAPVEPPFEPTEAPPAETVEQSAEPVVPFGIPEDAKEEVVKIVQFILDRRTDGKFHLQLYPEICGKPGQYAELKFTADRDRMWAMLEPVVHGMTLHTPMTMAVNWNAGWRQGRPTGKEKKDGSPGFYKDLLWLRKA